MWLMKQIWFLPSWSFQYVGGRRIIKWYTVRHLIINCEMICKGRKARYELILMRTQFRQVVGPSSNSILAKIGHAKSWYQAEYSRQSKQHA